MEQVSIRKRAAPRSVNPHPVAALVTPDLVRYSQKKVRYVGPHAYRGVEVVRLCGFGGDKTIRAERPASDAHSMVVLTRGSGSTLEAEFDGMKYAASGNRDLRASYLPEGAGAWMEFNPAARGLTIRIPPGLMAGYLDQAGSSANLNPLMFGSNPALIGLITMLDLSIVRPAPAQDVAVDQLMRSIALILGGVDPNGLAANNRRIVLTANRVRRVIDFIEDHLQERLTLDAIADVVGLSPFHFARAFKEATGVSPYRHVCDRRLLKAQRLLLSGNDSIGDVAQACGFGSLPHFSAAFTRERHISPREYRSQFGFG